MENKENNFLIRHFEYSRLWNELLLYGSLSILFALICSIWVSSASIIIAELIGFIVVFSLSKDIDRKVFFNIIGYKCVAIIVMLLIYNGNIQSYGQPYFMGGSDDLHFETIAKLFLTYDYVWPWDYPVDTNCNGMYWIISLIMRLSGGIDQYHTIAFRVLNVNILIAIGIVAYKISKIELEMDIYKSRRVQTVITLFPNILNISSYVFRDTLCSFIIILCSAICIDFSRKRSEYIISNNRIRLLIELLAITFIGYWLRKELFFIIVAIFVFSYVGDKLTKKNIIGLILIAAVGLYVLLKMDAYSFVIAKASRYLNYHAEYIFNHNSSDLYSTIFLKPVFPYGIILRSLYGLVFPLPTGLLKVRDLLNGLNFVDFFVSIGTCFQVVMLPYLFSGLKRNKTIALIFLTEFFSVILTTFTFRHFVLLYPFMLIIMLNDFYKDKVKSKKKLIFGVILLVSLGFIYIVYKFT